MGDEPEKDDKESWAEELNEATSVRAGMKVLMEKHTAIYYSMWVRASSRCSLRGSATYKREALRARGLQHGQAGARLAHGNASAPRKCKRAAMLVCHRSSRKRPDHRMSIYL